MAGIIQHTIDTFVDPTIASFYSNTTDAISSYVSTPFTSLATVAIILTAFAFFQGALEISAKRFFLMVATVVIVSTFATSASNFRQYIGDYVVGLPDEMMALTAKEAGSDKTTGSLAGAAIDAMFSQVINAANKTFKYGDWDTWSPYIYGALILIIGIIFTVALTIAIIIVKVGATVVAALGPLFVLGLLFSATREFFTKWLSFALQFTVIGAILGFYISLSIQIMTPPFEVMDKATDFQQMSQAYVPFFIFFPVLSLLFLMTSHFAAGITGGFAVSLGNFMQSATSKGMEGSRAVARRTSRPIRENFEANRRIRIQQKINRKTATPVAPPKHKKENFDDHKMRA